MSTLEKHDMRNTLQELVRRRDVLCAVQFGSSITGNTWEGSDIDVLVIAKRRKTSLERLLRSHLGHPYQLHVHSKTEFLASARRREPLSLSIVHTGKVLRNKAFVQRLKRFPPTEYTAKRCMLNSFAALGLCISDIAWMPYDAIDSMYHAARSALWATLMMREITPDNQRTLQLTDEKNRRLFSHIIASRHNIPKCTVDSKKLWLRGNYNKLTGLLDKAHTIIKQSYADIFNEKFIDFFELLSILRKQHRTPAHYSIFLFVDWKKQFPVYHITLSYQRKHVFLEVDARDGKVIRRWTALEPATSPKSLTKQEGVTTSKHKTAGQWSKR